MKKPYSSREIMLALTAAACALLVVVSGIYMAVLHAQAEKNSASAALVIAKDKELREKDAQANTTANYIDTICAEYRKLYGAYTDLRAQNPSAGSVGYSRPGAAKGEIDQCYQD
jgi:hypothetical protein